MQRGYIASAMSEGGGEIGSATDHIRSSDAFNLVLEGRHSYETRVLYCCTFLILTCLQEG